MQTRGNGSINLRRRQLTIVRCLEVREGVKGEGEGGESRRERVRYIKLWRKTNREGHRVRQRVRETK